MIFDAYNKSRQPMRDALDAPLSFEAVWRGRDAMVALVIFWGEADEVRAARCPDIILDMRDYTEVFRNQIRNAELLAAIQHRSAERLDDPIASLHPMFREHEA